MARYLITLSLFFLVLIAYLQINTALSLTEQWRLIFTAQAVEFEEFQFYYSTLPRAVLAMMVGGALGLVGSLFQQLTQNRLLSPMTLGAASGAWLVLICASVWAPALLADFGVGLATAGSMLAVGLVLLIAGRRGISGLPIILAGMAVHILLGAIASAVILLNEQYARHLFIWGAGDLTQVDWQWVAWLAPRLSVGLIILALAHHPLMLLRLGEQGAKARGLSILPILLFLVLIALWLVASAITAVGVIGFIGLLTPNIARSLGAGGALDELAYSVMLGAILLLATDAIAIVASLWMPDLIPTGTAAALIGAPCLIWFAQGRLTANDHTALQWPEGAHRVKPFVWWMVYASILVLLVLAFFFSPANLTSTVQAWPFEWPSELVFSLRWPRIVTAMAAGAGMAAAGVILQRLIRNPLASPDILGLSAGATLALVVTTVVSGGSIHEAGSIVAFIGSMGVLAILILLGRKHDYAPGIMILIGISLAALLEAVVHFVLAKGGDEVYSIIGWLAGSTYRVSARQSILLLTGVGILFGLCLLTSRWLTLISVGDQIALARGLDAKRARLVLLVLVALLCAMVTAIMGPVAFVGLLAPHMAALLGAKKALPQLVLAMLVGMVLMLLSDWLGRTVLYPSQMPAGTIASILGGSYFIYLLARRRFT